MPDLLVVAQFQDLIIVEKKSGWLSVPGRKPELDPRPVLGLLLQQQLQTQVFPIHRLDADVSGIMMYALSPQAQAVASRWFEKKQIQKKYQAVTGRRSFEFWPPSLERVDRDHPLNEKMHWTCHIVRGKKRSFVSSHGDFAETEAICLGQVKNYVHWLLWPLTGRSHQLRLELARRGYAICGDTLYGSQEKASTEGISLRAVSFDLSGIAPGERLGLPVEICVEGLFL